MENNPVEVVPEKEPHSSGNALTTDKASTPCEETKNRGGKISVLATKQYTDISNKPAQDESAVKNPAEAGPEASDEEITLSLHLSESDNLEDLMDEPIIGKSNKTIESEKYFSDIESSDDSQGYVSKAVPEEKVVGVGNQVSTMENVESGGASKEQASPEKIEKEKITELDLEPVESDEEDFDEISSLEERPKAPELEDLPIVEKKSIDGEKDESESHKDELSSDPKEEVNLLGPLSNQEDIMTNEDEKMPSPESKIASEEDEDLLLESTLETLGGAESASGSQAECDTSEQHDSIVDETNEEEIEEGEGAEDREDGPSSPGIAAKISCNKQNDSQNQLMEPETTELLKETAPEETNTVLATTEKEDLVEKQSEDKKDSEDSKEASKDDGTSKEDETDAVELKETSNDDVTSKEHETIETELIEEKKGEASESEEEITKTDKPLEEDEYFEKEESTTKIVSTCAEQPSAVNSFEGTTEDTPTGTDAPEETTDKIRTAEENTSSSTEEVKCLEQVSTVEDRETTDLSSPLETPKECEELTSNLEEALVEDTVNLVENLDSFEDLEKSLVEGTVKLDEKSDSPKDLEKALVEDSVKLAENSDNLKDDERATDEFSKETQKNPPLSDPSTNSEVAKKTSEDPEITKTVDEKKVTCDSVEDNEKEAGSLKPEEGNFGDHEEKSFDKETKLDETIQPESENTIKTTEAVESKARESLSTSEEKDIEVAATSTGSKDLEGEKLLEKDDKIIAIDDEMPPTDSKETGKETEKDSPKETSDVEKASEISDKQASVEESVAENGIKASPCDDSEMKEATDQGPQTEPPVTDDTTMKNADDGPSCDAEDEETLLVVDTSHKEEPYSEDVDMDTENEQTATSAPSTDSSSEGSLEIFYEKECVNYECKHSSKHFFRATMFTLNYYKISKKRTKPQFVCDDCYDRSLESYEKMCRTLKQKQPLLHETTFKVQEFVEIIDSSDEEENDATVDKIKDENSYSKESIQMLEAELEGAILKVMNSVELQNQLSWTKQILQQRLNNLEEDTNFVGEQLRLLQKQADHMHNSLYQCPKIKIRQLTPLDLNSGRTYNPEGEVTIPPVGEVLRCPIRVDETYFAVKNKAIASWVPCKVVEEIEGYSQLKNLKHFKIKFSKSKYPLLKTVSAKHMAFFHPPSVRLPIGTRVIAYFDASSLSRGKEKMLIPSAFYPGIIAEPLKQSNKFRYLVFYDDGYFQYVYHKDVRLVCQASENVWDDVHHQSREFIHNYLTQYSVNRPMVQTQKGQSMLVDYNNKWIYARVIDVDCSLVQMLFEGQNRSEWIYRGSTRLGPVYKESNNLVAKNSWNASRIARRTEPFIRYINGDDSSSSQTQQAQETQQQPKPGEVRSVAKKSVSRVDSSTSVAAAQPVPTVRHLNNSTIFVDDDNKPKGKVVYYTARKNLPPRDYVPHICSPTCPFLVTHNLSSYSPLAKPLLSGWERQVFRQKNKKFIVYRGPCGKRMRCMEELHRYLRVTENDLNVDNFDFGADTNCLAEYVIESCIVQKKDISNGKEKMPIPCVNYYDNTMPPDCIYSSKRIPTEGVPLNLDREFLVGCDCEDDCSDKAKCSCWELTYAGAKYGMPNVPNDMVGYQYKRLYEHVPTGIYECNSRCKCKANCVNRVVQQPLQSKLQVFKTSNRGWGLRCINDVPRGSFICVYAGHLLTEQKANEGGLDAGDEYFAELDYIEVAEQIKEGYESDVPELDEDEELYNPEKEDDDDEFIAPSVSNRAFSTRLRARRTTKNSSDAEHDSQERQVLSFEPNKTIGSPMDNSSSEKPTIRKLFGKDEACYVMDAKITGNLGRYFNHSCSPNLFVQNVFVDTHDLRFPWVAFFAFTHIRAGTELTWNYNYEVGVVPGKVLYCQCGAPNCRQRLL